MTSALTPAAPATFHFAQSMNSAPTEAVMLTDSAPITPILAFAARLTEKASSNNGPSVGAPFFPVRPEPRAAGTGDLPAATPVLPAPGSNAQMPPEINPTAPQSAIPDPLYAPPDPDPKVKMPRESAPAALKSAAPDAPLTELKTDRNAPEPMISEPKAEAPHPTPSTPQSQAAARATTHAETKPPAHPDLPESPQPSFTVHAAVPGNPPRTAIEIQTTPHETARELLPEAQAASFPVRDDPYAASPQPIREVAIRITNEFSQTADVRMLERNGEIQVAVRASDPVLANSLRSDLTDLVRNLTPAGLNTEVWHPGVTPQTAASSDARQEDTRGGGFSQQTGGQDFQQSGSRQQQGGRQQAPPWLEDFEFVPGSKSIRRKNS